VQKRLKMCDGSFYFCILKCISLSEALYFRISSHDLYFVHDLWNCFYLGFYWYYAATGSTSDPLNHFINSLKPIVVPANSFFDASSVTHVQLPSCIQPFWTTMRTTSLVDYWRRQPFIIYLLTYKAFYC